MTAGLAQSVGSARRRGAKEESQAGNGLHQRSREL